MYIEIMNPSFGIYNIHDREKFNNEVYNVCNSFLFRNKNCAEI